LNSISAQGRSELTPNDTLKVTVRYRYIVATRMLYRDYCGKAKEANQQLYTIQQQDLKIKALNKSYTECFAADSARRQAGVRDSILLKNNERQIVDLRLTNMQNKIGKIASSVFVPVAAVVGFLAGWYLHK